MITIVSGLPRSGTSLMMQMLAAGGVTALTDGERQADTDNPRGYYEWERIKSLPREPNCIDQAEGCAVKVISQLLFALPTGHEYRIIFMERPLAEVVSSQAEMIRRRQTTGAALGETALIAVLQAHLNQVNAWLKQRPDLRLHRVNYHDTVRQPAMVSAAIELFLERTLDKVAMALKVDPSLYRHSEAARTPIV